VHRHREPVFDWIQLVAGVVLEVLRQLGHPALP
jgi:hypothetical protein